MLLIETSRIEKVILLLYMYIYTYVSNCWYTSSAVVENSKKCEWISRQTRTLHSNLQRAAEQTVRLAGHLTQIKPNRTLGCLFR